MKYNLRILKAKKTRKDNTSLRQEEIEELWSKYADRVDRSRTSAV